MRDVTCHWITFGKLIDAASPEGAILRGVDHQVTRLSDGFPDDLARRCTLPALLGRMVGTSLAIAPPALASGAMVYRPFVCDSGAYAVFARLRAPHEGGRSGTGRVFDQFSALAVRVEDWAPDLVPAMHRALFDDRFADPDLSDDPRRLGCARPVLRVPPLAEGARDRPDTTVGLDLSQEAGSAMLVSDTVRQAVPMLAATLGCMAWRGHALAALPWALGLDPAIAGPGAGFALRHRQTRPAAGISPAGAAAALDDRLGLSAWCGFADLIDTQGNPAWTRGRVSKKRPSGASLVWQSLGAVPPAFLLPVPHHRTGFAQFVLNVTRGGEAVIPLWPGAAAFVDELSAMASAAADPTDICGEIDRALSDAADRSAVDRAIQRFPSVRFGCEVWQMLLDLERQCRETNRGSDPGGKPRTVGAAMAHPAL